MKKIIFLLIALSGCARNVDYIKAHAPARFQELGYTTVGYEGYQIDTFDGGHVWYTLKRSDSPGILYEASLMKWNGELHLYNITVISGNQIQLNQKGN